MENKRALGYLRTCFNRCCKYYFSGRGSRASTTRRRNCSYLFSQLVFMLRHGFLQLWNLCLLLLDDAPQMFDAVMVGQLVFGHLKPARSQENRGFNIREHWLLLLILVELLLGISTRQLVTHPHPSSQLTGLLGLCSQSLRCDCSWSSRRVAVQPKPALSQLIWSLDSMLRMMRGTGRRWASVTTVRSTGQICCWANHCVIQALQKACSQCGACTGSSRTPLHIGHSRSSSTSPWNLVTSYPMVHHWEPRPPERHKNRFSRNLTASEHKLWMFDMNTSAYLTHKRPQMLPFSSRCSADTSCREEIKRSASEGTQTLPAKNKTKISVTLVIQFNNIERNFY